MRLQFHLAGALVALCCAITASTTSAADRPNIVVIVADDLGSADLGYRGSKIKTPNIDGLAKGGVRLESYYGLPLCTPARAALMTGRYPMRHGLQTLVIFPSHKYGLPTDEKTLPQALKEVGYGTYMVGKWHLGHADKKYWPQNRGFDHFYGNVVGEVDYFTKDRAGIIDWQRNGTFLKEDGYYTHQIGSEAVGLIEKHDTSKPLFMFTTDNGGATSALFATGARSPEDREASGGVALDQKPPCSNAPFSGGKGTLKEGGVRLPAIVNWPAKLKPRVVNEPLHHVDVMPTLLAVAGAKGDPTRPFDGKDAMPTIADGKPSPHDDILINVEAFRGAIRKGNWKLIKVATLPGKTELFDLSKDPAEKENVADKHPAVVRDLESRLLNYAKQQKMSEWLKSQVDYLGFQGETFLDPGYSTDGGLPHEKPVLPKQ